STSVQALRPSALDAVARERFDLAGRSLHELVALLLDRPQPLLPLAATELVTAARVARAADLSSLLAEFANGLHQLIHAVQGGLVTNQVLVIAEAREQHPISVRSPFVQSVQLVYGGRDSRAL